MSTELATTERSATLAFEPNDFDSAVRMAKILVSSRLLPKGVPTPEAAFAIILTGRELGLTAMQSLRSIHVIEGKPTLSADLMLALAKRAPECLYFRMVSSDGCAAKYETHRRGEPSPTPLSFTIEEARTAGLLGKDNWKKYAPAMLRARCISALARAVYPDVFMGIYETDEVTPVESRRRGPVVEMMPAAVEQRDQAPPVAHDSDGVVPDDVPRHEDGLPKSWGGPAEAPPEDEPAWIGEDSATQEAAEKLRSVDRAKRELSLCAQTEMQVKRCESRRAVEKAYREAFALNLAPERIKAIADICAARCKEIEATQPLGKVEAPQGAGDAWEGQ